jgi:hypothetical protein
MHEMLDGESQGSPPGFGVCRNREWAADLAGPVFAIASLKSKIQTDLIQLLRFPQRNRTM